MFRKNVKGPMSSKNMKAGTSQDSQNEQHASETEDEVLVSPPEVKSNTFMYPSDDKPLKILETLDECRKTGDFCDIQIKLSPGNTIYAHKAILSACSAYFEGMFTSTFMEATSDVIDLSHTTENSEIVENVINSFYGHKFEIIADNVVEVMNLANMFFIDDLKEACAQVLRTIISLQNAAEMLQLSFSFGIKDLRDLVSPLVESRFHDYIMFQEDLIDMGNDCFEYILQIQKGFISRKDDYIRLILNWFNRLENDERAQVAMKGLTKYRQFEVSEYTYKEVESNILEVMNSLEAVNSDLSQDIREKFIQVLKDLKPDNYSPEESYESDLEESRDLDIQMPSNSKIKFIGPHTERMGYTDQEEAAWAEHACDMSELDKLEEKWKQHLEEKKKKNIKIFATKMEDPQGNELRKKLFPMRSRHEKTSSEFKKRNLKVKPPEQLDEEARLLDMLIVLAPSIEYVEGSTDEGSKDDTMIVCGFVPRKNAWYRLGSLNANGVEKRVRKGPSVDPEDMMEMMEDMPPHHRHRMMKQMARKSEGMSSKYMHRMMMMDMEEDMMFHPMMMMRPDMFGHMGGRHMKPKVESLLKGKWKMAYLKQTLYFYHKEHNSKVWSYDLTEQLWKEYGFSTSGKSHESNWFPTDEGLELITMGQVLYAVVTIALLDTRNDFWSKRSRSETSSRTIKTKFLILKLTEKERFELVCETDSYESYLDKSQFEKPVEDKRDADSEYTFERAAPMLPGVLKTVLFREDDEKLDIFLMHSSKYEGQVTFRLSFMLVVYLDSLDDEKNLDVPYNHNFLREITPLVHDDVLALINDELRVDSIINLAKPEDDDRLRQFAGYDPERLSPFMEDEETYPKYPIITSNNGKFMWVLEGSENDISRMTEVRPKAHQDYLSRKVGKRKIVPPPVRCFSLACPGHIDRNILRRYNPPTKYLHI